jgi:hypothetical protein
MSAQARGAKLDPCPATSSSTDTSRASAASRSRHSRGTRARSVTERQSCRRSGGHAIWWNVEAASEEEALRLLPAYVAERTTATRVSEVEIP